MAATPSSAEQRLQVLEDGLDTTRQLLSDIVDKVGQLEEEKNGDLSRLDEIRNEITEVKERLLKKQESARTGMKKQSPNKKKRIKK